MLIRGEIIKHVAKIDICHFAQRKLTSAISLKETTCEMPMPPLVSES